MEKFRVISDLHLDYNHDYPVKLKKDGIFTLIAGDLCGESHVIHTKSSRKELTVHVNMEAFQKKFGDKAKVVFKYTKPENKDIGEWSVNGKQVALRECKVSISGEWKDGDKVTVEIYRPSDWVDKNISSGLLVAGNHVVYTHTKKPIEDIKKGLSEQYPIDSNFSFLDQSTGIMSKEVDGILFIGSTLYTNYELKIKNFNPSGNVTTNMRVASPKMSGGGLNDFNYGRTVEGTYKKQPWDDDDGIYFLTPENYLRFFNRTFAEIKRLVEENKDKEIVILTHHCPSPKCAYGEYVDNGLNASYMSDLTDFIIKHKNIKCWVCGHVHHRASFKIGDCLCIMNPLGYIKHGEYVENGGNWSPNTFVNTKTWTVEKEEYSNKTWDNTIKEYRNNILKYAGIFF